MPDPKSPSDDHQGWGPLWVEGGLRLRLRTPRGQANRVFQIPRPFALIGRGAGADLRIDSPAASIRHAYLHLDHRGLFSLDLATRTGTRFQGHSQAAAWLQAGDQIEIAEHLIEVLEVQTAPTDPESAEHQNSMADRPDLLDDAQDRSLTRLTLFPHQPPWESRDMDSELIVLGRGPHCAISLQGESIARIHAVLVRTPTQVFVVDLSGGRTQINGRPIPRASALRDGDVLAIGSAQFEARVRTWESAPILSESRPRPSQTEIPRPSTEIELAQAFPIPRDLPDLPDQLPAEAQGAVLAWLVQAVQAGQGEALRRQGEFQHALTDMVRQICLDNASMLHEHLQRMESINTELAGLRDEIRRRLGPAPPPPPPPKPAPPPLRIAPVESPPADAEQSTSWLLDRVHRLEEENRSTWRDLLGRLGGGGGSGQNRQAP